MDMISATTLSASGVGAMPTVPYVGTEFSGSTKMETKESNFIWSSDDIVKLAQDPRMADVVESLVGPDVRAFQSLLPFLPWVEEAIDSKPEWNIRGILLMHAKSINEADDLRTFAELEDAGATCESKESAGGYGLEACVARCNAKGVRIRGRTPAYGACYTLCSVAVAPCGHRPFKVVLFVTNMWIALVIAAMRVGVIFCVEFPLTVAIGSGFDGILMAVVYLIHEICPSASWSMVPGAPVADTLIDDILVALLIGMVALLAFANIDRWRMNRHLRRRLVYQVAAARNLNARLRYRHWLILHETFGAHVRE